MIIRNLFKKDINRQINGVVKADQIQNEVVWQELDEYVVTPDVKEHLDKFFTVYCNSLQRGNDATSSNGCWISGFFGSGKSHFLKILAYLLQNNPVSLNGEVREPVKFFPEKPQCKDPIFLGNMEQAAGVPCDTVLFNIDSKSDAKKGKDAILRVFTNVFNGLCGYSDTYPHLANIERALDGQGHYEAFQEEFEKITKKPWKKHRKAYLIMVKQTAKAISIVTDQNQESMEQMLTNKNNTFTVTIEDFAQSVKEYLDKKEKNHRVVFLVDEIGQYIGKDSDLMLNLQTITENLGTKCEGKAWVVVTSQENIEGVIGEVSNRQNQDFSKIQGRFITRLNFASNQAHQVIQDRILEKDEQIQPELSQIYKGKGDILRNQLSFVKTGMTLESFEDETDFIDNYPFVPYQYKLIQKVFQKLRDVNVTGGSTSRGERSMLNAFQLAAISVQDNDLGLLIPFWSFYAAIKETLDTVIKKTIQEAMDSSFFNDFDTQVLKTLFLIRYVDEIPGTIDNLMTLSVSMIDEDKKVLRQKVEEGLQKLERETLINRVGEEFFFLTNEERDIRNEIKAITLDAGEDSRALSNIIFTDLLEVWKSYRYPINNRDFQFNRYCDEQPQGQVTNTDISLSIITPLSENYALWAEDAKCFMDSDTKVIVRFGNSDILTRDLNTFLKTDKFLKKDHSGGRASKEQILGHIRREHREQKQSLLKLTEELLSNGDIFGISKKLDISSTKGAKPRLEEAVQYLIDNKYNKLSYIETPPLDEKSILKEIRQIINNPASTDVQLSIVDEEVNKRALDEVEEYLKIRGIKQQTIKLKEVIENFEGIPFGWNKYETVRLLARLFVKGSVEFVADNILPPNKIVEKFEKPSSWAGVVIKKREVTSSAVIKKAIQIGNDIFSVSLPKEEKDLTKQIKHHLEKWQDQLKVWGKQAMDGNPGETQIQEALDIVTNLTEMRNSTDFLKTFVDKQDELDDTNDFFDQLSKFYKTQKPVWDELKIAVTNFKLNESYLRNSPDLAAKLDDLISIREMESPYGRLKDVHDQVNALQTKNQELLENARITGLNAIEQAITRITAEIETAKAQEKSYECLRPLQVCKQNIEKQVSIPHIESEISRIVEFEDEANEIIRSYLESINNGGGTPPPIKDKVKVNPVEILKGKTILDKQEDVDDYLKNLGQKMEKLIKEGKRIQIISS
jgi:hypothetical protein